MPRSMMSDQGEEIPAVTDGASVPARTASGNTHGAGSNHASTPRVGLWSMPRIEQWASVRRWLGEWGSESLGLILPVYCPACGELLNGGNRSTFCAGCLPRLEDQQERCRRCAGVARLLAREEGPICGYCLERPPAFERTWQLGPYQGKLRDLVLRAKQPVQRHLATELARHLVQKVRSDVEAFQPTAVVAIPAHWLRAWRRGGNQAQTLASSVSAELSLPLWNVLYRTKPTRPQSQLTRRARAKNMRGAFRVRNRTRLEGARMLLVDDTLTTGATCEAAAKSLLEAGAAAVGVLILCRADE